MGGGSRFLKAYTDTYKPCNLQNELSWAQDILWKIRFQPDWDSHSGASPTHPCPSNP